MHDFLFPTIHVIHQSMFCIRNADWLFVTPPMDEGKKWECRREKREERREKREREKRDERRETRDERRETRTENRTRKRVVTP